MGNIFSRQAAQFVLFDDVLLPHCPECGSGEYMTNEDENFNNFCGQCGTRLDWSAYTEFRAKQNKLNGAKVLTYEMLNRLVTSPDFINMDTVVYNKLLSVTRSKGMCTALDVLAMDKLEASQRLCSIMNKTFLTERIMFKYILKLVYQAIEKHGPPGNAGDAAIEALENWLNDANGVIDDWGRKRMREAANTAAAAAQEMDEAARNSEVIRPGCPLEIQRRLTWCYAWAACIDQPTIAVLNVVSSSCEADALAKAGPRPTDESYHGKWEKTRDKARKEAWGKALKELQSLLVGLGEEEVK